MLTPLRQLERAVLQALKQITQSSHRKLQTADQHMKPLIRRHYGDAKETVKDRTSRRKKAQPATLVNGLPQIPEVKQQDPARQKLHYRINDGSSFI